MLCSYPGTHVYTKSHLFSVSCELCVSTCTFVYFIKKNLVSVWCVFTNTWHAFCPFRNWVAVGCPPTLVFNHTRPSLNQWLDMMEVLVDEGAPKCTLNHGNCMPCKVGFLLSAFPCFSESLQTPFKSFLPRSVLSLPFPVLFYCHW